MTTQDNMDGATALPENSPSDNDRLKRIYCFVGPKAVLLLLKGKSPIDEGWPRKTLEQTKTKAYQERLCKARNIGVLLGEGGNDICTIDVDSDEWVQPLIKANPFLADTLRTPACS